MKTENPNTLPTWILIVSGLFAVLEIMVSMLLYFSPQSVVEQVDLEANGVIYILNMWAARQFALGFIFAYATIKNSAPMLMICYIFFFVMFIGDLFIGILEKNNTFIISAMFICMLSSAMIFFINKAKNK